MQNFLLLYECFIQVITEITWTAFNHPYFNSKNAYFKGALDCTPIQDISENKQKKTKHFFFWSDDVLYGLNLIVYRFVIGSILENLNFSSPDYDLLQETACLLHLKHILSVHLWLNSLLRISSEKKQMLPNMKHAHLHKAIQTERRIIIKCELNLLQGIKHQQINITNLSSIYVRTAVEITEHAF